MNAWSDGDLRVVAKAARVVGVRVAFACCILVVVIVATVLLVVLDQSQPGELLEPARPGEHKIFVDAGKIVLSLAVAGGCAILFAGVVSWLIARQAVRPLGDALRLQRDFVADASHELRTPLAVLDARIQLLRHRSSGDETLAAGLDALKADSAALIEIVNDLLLVASVDRMAAQQECADVADGIQAALSGLRVLADARAIRLTFDGGEALTVSMHETSFRRCITALVDNAVRHSEGGSEVLVTVRREGGMAAIDVRDHGGGIRGIDPSRVFERFAHAEARPGEDGVSGRGFGIGLSLVRDLAVRHGGDVSVAETSPRGTVFTLRLPVSPDGAAFLRRH